MKALLLILLFSCLQLFSQDTTIIIYYKTGQSKLTAAQQKQLEKLKSKELVKITFDGYADTVGTNSFNKKLSYKRAEKVANNFNTQDKKITGKGELHERKTSINKMRKVVVKAWYVTATAIVPETTDVIKIAAEPIKCNTDTVITSAGGIQIHINKCEFEKIKKCFTFKEYLDARAVQEAGITTTDEKGNPIESGGMFDIQFCDKNCLSNPIIIYVPVPECMKGKTMNLWNYRPNGNWRNSGKKLEILNIKGKDFYKIELLCPGRFNCDRPKDVRQKNFKFKAKNGIRIKEATVSFGCPLTSIKGEVKRRGKKVIFPYYCPQDQPIVSIKAKDKNGDTLNIKSEPLNNYTKKRRLISACRCEQKKDDKYLGIFKIRKKYLYRKYKFYREDFRK